MTLKLCSMKRPLPSVARTVRVEAATKAGKVRVSVLPEISAPIAGSVSEAIE